LMPGFKCEFVGVDKNKELGRIATNEYDGRKMGQWQQLSVEFRAPDGTVAFGWLWKRTPTLRWRLRPCSMTFELSPFSRLSLYDRYRIDPLPARMQALKGVHPRLYLTQDRIVQLKAAIKTRMPSCTRTWIALADRYAARGAPAYIERDKYSGDEQLWQREVGKHHAIPRHGLCAVR